MKTTYKQLTADERDKIALFMAGGANSNNIARMLGRNRSTISREIKRNGASKYKSYTPHAAEARSKHRKSVANAHPRLKNRFIRDYVHQKIKDGWSPEIISGTLKKEHPENSISHESIYQYIYADAQELKNYLPRHYRVRRKRKAKKLVLLRISLAASGLICVLKKSMTDLSSDTGNQTRWFHDNLLQP